MCAPAHGVRVFPAPATAAGTKFYQTVDNRPARRIVNHMVDKQERLDSLFRALADPTRRAMLRDLAAGPRTVGELAAPFDISLAGASKHIQMLERAGLIRREVQGRVHTCSLDAQPLHACPVCLRKLKHALRFDPLARYRALHEFYRARQWFEDADWVARQLKRVVPAPASAKE